MKKDLINKMIPVETLDKKTWYMDVNNLSLSELFKLKDELKNKSDVSIRVIDGIIRHSTIDNYNYNKRDIEKSKQGYRNIKILMKMKRKGR